MLHKRRNLNIWYSASCVLGGISFALSAWAQPALPPTQELLELPSFDKNDTEKKEEPVTLELMPEGALAPSDETVTTPPVVVTPADGLPVESLDVIVPSAETASAVNTTMMYEESFGPPISGAVTPEQADAAMLTENTSALQPAQEQASQTAVQVSQEEFGPAVLNAANPSDPNSAEIQASLRGISDPGGTVIPDDWQDGSLMFSREEIERYKAAILTPKEVLEEQVEDQVASAQPEAYVPDYGAFSLNSILYQGKDSWSVWLNGKKFRPNAESPLERVELVKLTNKHATFRWKPSGKVTIPPELLSNKLKQEEDGSILMTISANQTLIVEGMQFFEGRTITREIKLLLIAAKKRMLAQKAAAEAAALAQANQNNAVASNNINALQALPPQNNAPVDRDAQNMNTLINQYRNAGRAK
jgi:hypothetical protein